jgi:hypothetical protein
LAPTGSYSREQEVLFLIWKLTMETLASVYEWVSLRMIAYAFSAAERVD